MRRIIWSKSFIRASKRVIKKRLVLSEDLEGTLKDLVEDPFLPHLETHKLKGKVSGSWACTVGYDLRIVFDFVDDNNQEEDGIFLIDIGTHDEVY
jgi:addiction module RelE/StbE family toxin